MLRTVGLGNILTSVLCLKAGVVCCLPACAKGSSVYATGNFGFWLFLGFLVSSVCFVHDGGFGWAFTSGCVQDLGLWGVPFFRFRSLDVRRVGYYLHDLGGDNWAAHNTVCLFWGWVCFVLELYMLALVGLPSLRGYYACMVFRLKGHSGEIAG